jgi:hypothetical protein
VTSEDKQNEQEVEEKKEAPSTFVFDPTDPFRVEFEDGYLNLILRTGIEQEGKDPIPLQEIVVPITFTLDGSKVIFEAATPRVTSVGPAGRLKQITRAAQIRRIIEAKLPRRELDTEFDFMVEDHRIAMNANSIRSNDGWISVDLNARQSRVMQYATPVIQPYNGQVIQPYGGTVIQGATVVYPSHRSY